MSEDGAEVIAKIVETRGLELTVSLPDGKQVDAVLDTEELRSQHGPMYGLSVGDNVVLILDNPCRVVFLITYAASQEIAGN